MSTQVDNWKEQKSSSKYDTYPRTDITYCYVCNGRIETLRVAGDKRNRNEDRATIERCAYAFIQPDDLDIHSVICSSQACHLIYNELPAARYLELQIPHYKSTSFDGLSFHDFFLLEPVQTILNVQTHYLHQGALPENFQNNLDALLQEWLFFSLCREILGRHFDPSACIIRTDEGHPVLTLSTLPQAITVWLQSADRQSEVARNHLSRANEALTVVSAALYMTMFLEVSEDSRFFFASVAELLSHAIRALHPSQEPLHSLAIFFPQSKAARLEELGWCPNEAKKFTASPFSLSTRALYFQLDRRNLRPRHLQCSKDDCVESYKALQSHLGPVHRHDCSNRVACREVSINQARMEKMCGILNTNRFPLLSIRTDSAGVADSVEVVPSQEGTRYVAISHVWSQGLGNQLNNSVFQCQLSRLHNLVKNLEKIVQRGERDQELLIWLDTLCCPLHSKDARNSALRLMRQTYASATMVLALDSEWEHVDVTKRSCLEIAAHIFSSSWIWRLWTFQEGSLPETLFFQFADRPVEAQSLHLALRDVRRRLNMRDRTSAGEQLAMFQTLRMFSGMYQSLNRQQEVQMMAIGMAKRVATRRRDEAFCIATLLGYDTASILEDQAPEVRMQKLWHMLSREGCIRRSIAFGAFKTLETHGYTWAPATFFQSVSMMSFAGPDTHAVRMTNAGLLLNGAGFVLRHIPQFAGFNFSRETATGSSSSSDPLMSLSSNSITNVLNLVGTDRASEEVMNVELAPGSWAQLFGMDAFHDAYENRSIGNEKSFQAFLSHSRKKIGVLMKHLSTDETSQADDGTGILVEIRSDSDDALLCARQKLISLKPMTGEESARYTFARVRADDLRSNEEFLAMLAAQKDDLRNDTNPNSVAARLARMHCMEYLQFDQHLRKRAEIPDSMRDLPIDEDSFGCYVAEQLEGHCAMVEETFPESQMWCLE